MNDEISAVVQSGFEYGKRFIEVEFLAHCGCRWKVDMWGNMRTVFVCRHCMEIDPLDYQLSLMD